MIFNVFWSCRFHEAQCDAAEACKGTILPNADLMLMPVENDNPTR
jgi:hypothetical protein